MVPRDEFESGVAFRETLGNRRGRVAGTVIDDEAFPVGCGLALYARERC